MSESANNQWENLVVTPDQVLAYIRPGMTIFLGSGVAETRTLMKCLIDSGLSNTNDMELIQLTSHGDVLSLKKLDWQRYRLKTFFSTWVASEAVIAGSVDLIPSKSAVILSLWSCSKLAKWIC